ncbi:MAG: bacterio-opsin activator [Bacteroidota bacterium]|jgi:PAS domain S-box-containing protein|nr:bacterio-opsin activator [Bacteroidota bacterium]
MSLVTDSILEKLNSLIVVVNSKGEVEYVSPSAKRILGFEPDALMGQGWWDLTRDNDAERNDIRSLALNQLKQDSLLATLPYERLLKTANGGERWILWNTSKGPMNTLVGIGHDITDRKKAEQQLLKKNKELEQHNKDMVDSITYASRIQEAILPDVQQIRNAFKDAFVLYQPKDVVSGDYYFFHRKKDKVFVAAVDCTGHGVPGALMSFIANSILKEVIIKKGLEEPSEILYALDEELFLSLNKQNSDGVTNDGMDVALGVFDLSKNTLTYSGAFRPMIMIRENEIIEFDPNRYPIGFYGDVKKEFVSRTIELQENDTFYFFTDGYCDQFGGELKKKFNRRRFKELLLSAQSMEMEEQESFLQYALLNWRQEEEQMDDILVMGVKI